MIGILGGTFDPIHFGHIKPALDLLRVLPLQEIRFLPCHVPPHRASPLASARDRWRMVQMVTENQPGFVADDHELRREGPSYMVDTLLELRAELGAEKPLCLILGADAFIGLESWHRWQEIPDLAHIVITARPGIDLPQQGALADLLRQHIVTEPAELLQAPAGAILPCEVSLLDISSTQIRQMIAAGQQPHHMLPGNVWNYIKRHRLYNVGRK